MSPERLGQHFLNRTWREKIARTIFGADATESRADGVWIEIGAGHGEMTPLLAPHAGKVIAIELDSKLTPQLSRTIAPMGNVTLAHGDVLALDLGQLANGEPFSVYGNLPYYITSPIVHRLFEHPEQLRAAFIVIQLEVALRMAAKPGSRDYGYFSVFTQFYAATQILLRIPPGAFQPPPKVVSALVALRPPGERANLGLREEHAFMEFLKVCFAHKRKTLRNNLRAITTDAEGTLETAGIQANARAEQLSVSELARLFTAIRSDAGAATQAEQPPL